MSAQSVLFHFVLIGMLVIASIPLAAVKLGWLSVIVILLAVLLFLRIARRA